MNGKPKYVTFRDKRLESSFEKLKEGKFKDKQLYYSIQRATKDLKKDLLAPLKYLKNYGQNFTFKNMGLQIYGNMIYQIVGD